MEEFLLYGLLKVENSIAYSCKHLFIISNFINELFGGCPAETGIGNGFTVNAVLYLLAAVLDIGLNHKALNHLLNIVAVAHGMEHLICDSDLLHIFFTAV